MKRVVLGLVSLVAVAGLLATAAAFLLPGHLALDVSPGDARVAPGSA